MLRFLLIALVVANLGYFVWARGDTDGAGRGDREPQRLAQQLRPQLLQIRRPAVPIPTAATAIAPSPTPAAAPAPAPAPVTDVDTAR